MPRSIYEIDGARECAVEFRSFSKNAGFTGVRCAFTVVPAGLTGTAADGSPVEIGKLWDRRQSTKFNGVSYIVQRGAAAVYTEAGRKETGALVDFYMENARLIREGLQELGVEVHGGVNAPYVWLKTPGTDDSWTFFDRLLTDAGVVGTPGAGFGAAGEGYFRLSAFNSRENVEAALGRIREASVRSSGRTTSVVAFSEKPAASSPTSVPEEQSDQPATIPSSLHGSFGNEGVDFCDLTAVPIDGRFYMLNFVAGDRLD